MLKAVKDIPEIFEKEKPIIASLEVSTNNLIELMCTEFFKGNAWPAALPVLTLAAEVLPLCQERYMATAKNIGKSTWDQALLFNNSCTCRGLGGFLPASSACSRRYCLRSIPALSLAGRAMPPHVVGVFFGCSGSSESSGHHNFDMLQPKKTKQMQPRATGVCSIQQRKRQKCSRSRSQFANAPACN